MIYQIGELKPVLDGDVFVADSADLIGDVILRRNASVWFNSVIRADNDTIEVGEGSNIQDGSVIHTDPGLPVHIGEGVSVGHRAVIHGCTIGDGSLIGINAVVLNRARIGRCCLIGANALVTEGREIPDFSLALGSPAKVVRQLSEAEIAGLREIADGYVEKIRRYVAEMGAVV